MSLLIIQHLQTVLESAQEQICLVQTRDCRITQQLGATQARQHRQQRYFAQQGILTTANQLQRLRSEFDLADAAGPQLDVIGQVTSYHLAGDQTAHLTQRIEHAKIKVASINKRPQHIRLYRRKQSLTGQRPRFDIGIAFPVAARRLQVVFKRCKTADQRTAIAVRSQPQVNTEHKAVGGAFIEQTNQHTRLLQKELFATERQRPVSAIARCVQQHQINIR